jgi:hypothetical protein
VTISVTDGAPVSGVVVSGTWSAGSGGGSCTTDATGTCIVTASLNKKAPSTTTYSVTNLSRSGWAYQPASNFATQVTVTKP